MQKVIIVGATSGIGKGLAGLFVSNGSKVGITGRRENLLKEIHEQNKEKYIYKVGDVNNHTKMCEQLDQLHDELGGLDVLIISAGTGEINPHLTFDLEEPTLNTNVLGFTNVVNWGYKKFEQQKKGHLIIISSVAAIRGNAFAPAYNASKSFQSNYIEGIRIKAYKQHLPIYVTDIRPGFVDTDMAKGEGLFWVASVSKATGQIYKAIMKKKKIVYVSKRWKYIAQLLKILPYSIYRKI